MDEQIFSGNLFADDRGYIRFFNDFNEWNQIVRMYQVENRKVDSVRAYHGHRKETKYVYVVSGAILLVVATTAGVRGWHVLDSSRPQILKLAPDGAQATFHGFKILEPNTIIQFFSNKTLEESKSDDFRLNWDIFGGNEWRDKYR